MGTTVFAVTDPIDEIVKVAKKYNCWVHIDACFGGYAMLLDEVRN